MPSVLNCRKIGEWPRLLTSLAQTKQWGARSFAQFAKGGNRERIHNGFVQKGQNCVGRIATRPCKKRKDGAPLQRWRTRTTKESVGHPPRLPGADLDS